MFSELAQDRGDTVGAHDHWAGSRQRYFRGPLRDTPGNAPWREFLGGAPTDVLLVPLVIGANSIAFLYADNGNDAVLDANVARLSQLATMGSIAFEILKLKERLSVA